MCGGKNDKASSLVIIFLLDYFENELLYFGVSGKAAEAQPDSTFSMPQSNCLEAVKENFRLVVIVNMRPSQRLAMDLGVILADHPHWISG